MPVVPKKFFFKCLSIFFLVKWVFHKLYIFQFQICDSNWPSLLCTYVHITLKCFVSFASVALLQHLWIHLSLYLYATFEMLTVQEIAINQSKFSQFFSLLVNGAKAARIKNTKKNILRQFYKNWSHVTCWIL